MADGDAVIARLQAGGTMTAEVRRYRVAWPTLWALVDGRLGIDARLAIWRRNVGKAGKASRFRKGHKPWNRGRTGWCPDGCKATQFKPGAIRGAAARRLRAIGTVVMRRQHRRGRKGVDLHRVIKIEDLSAPSGARWIPVAEYLWRQAKRALPAGWFVVHEDGDTLNDALDNLLAVDRPAHMARLKARPDVEQRRKARQASAMGRSAGDGPAGAIRVSRRVVRTGWLCPGCGWDSAARPQRCPKCGGTRFEAITHSLLPVAASDAAGAADGSQEAVA